MVVTEIDPMISLIEVKLEMNYTDEQKALIRRFGDGPTFCFADPGTGKTSTAIGGLLIAELYKQIPGSNIYALSFTNKATGELAVRHDKACRKLGISRTPTFRTLHGLCLDLLLKHYKKLGMYHFDTKKPITIGEYYKLVESACDEWNMPINPKKIRSVVQACQSLNSALIFDQDNVMSKIKYKETGLEYDDFEKIRGLIFNYSLNTERISVSEILLYALLLLTWFPEVSAECKQNIKLMLVDEAQDLSLLHLRVISLLTDNPVFIGDMKQQIYAFNGACQEIIAAFFKQYPDAEKFKLTKSFRCKQAIADYATKIISYNNVGGEDFQGCSEGGIVDVAMSGDNAIDGVRLEDIIENIYQDYVDNGKRFSKEIMFLFRNNVSAIPIAELLFKKHVPVRVHNYKPAYELPLIKEIIEILKLAENPCNYSNVMALRYLIPEFREYNVLTKNPFYVIGTKTGTSIFEINYEFRDVTTGSKAMMLLLKLSEMIGSGASMKDLINTMWTHYNVTWVEPNTWRLDQEPMYYLRSIAPLVEKTFSQFVKDEVDKSKDIETFIRHNVGVRCYTMHASKGLEADIVYICDANEGMIPNTKELQKMVDAHSEMDAARSIREERALCYVACTRAKEELHILYTGQPASILLGANPYSEYDKIYKYYSASGDDILAFNQFAKKYVEL